MFLAEEEVSSSCDKENPIDDLSEQVVHHIPKPVEVHRRPTIIIDKSVPSGAESINTNIIGATVPKVLKEMTASKCETINPNKVILSRNPNQPTIQNEHNINYITADDFGSLAAPTQYIACQNSNLLGNTANACKNPISADIPCNLPNKLTAENYYKTHYLGQIIPMNDYTTKGYNYWEYSDDVDPRTMRYQRILSQNTKGLPPEDTRYKNIPVGWNYAFHNTPALSMP